MTATSELLFGFLLLLLLMNVGFCCVSRTTKGAADRVALLLGRFHSSSDIYHRVDSGDYLLVILPSYERSYCCKLSSTSFAVLDASSCILDQLAMIGLNAIITTATSTVQYRPNSFAARIGINNLGDEKINNTTVVTITNDRKTVEMDNNFLHDGLVRTDGKLLLYYPIADDGGYDELKNSYDDPSRFSNATEFTAASIATELSAAKHGGGDIVFGSIILDDNLRRIIIIHPSGFCYNGGGDIINYAILIGTILHIIDVALAFVVLYFYVYLGCVFV